MPNPLTEFVALSRLRASHEQTGNYAGPEVVFEEIAI
jgi:hypothetical protein